MITLALLKFLENNNLGTIDTDLFWQKLTLGKVGIYITSIGQSRMLGERKVQRFELYSRGTDDVDGLQRLERIIDFLNDSYNVCELPAVEGITEGFKNITIAPLGTPTSLGEDTTGRVVYSVVGEISY